MSFNRQTSDESAKVRNHPKLQRVICHLSAEMTVVAINLEMYIAFWSLITVVLVADNIKP